ncbi:MAG TPA: exopolyphosphatase [Candidatus Lustribacter sp.]|nr:exopolyphosphatase [Candidatus Lustribacter sp.]
MSTMTRVAAVDCGTNSIRLLIAAVDSSGALHDIVRRMEIVRLGHGVDRTGVIEPAAMARTLAMAREYAAQCVDHEVEAVRFVATSASRDARNAGEFIEGVTTAFARFGTAPEVVPGDVEAELSFTGATGDAQAAGLPGPYLVVDIGGGSTELVRGFTRVEQKVSVDVGCVRLTERRLHSDPPTEDEIRLAVADIDEAIDLAMGSVDLAGVGTLIGLAGSITTITAYALDLPSYQPERVHLSRLPVADVQRACADLLHRTRAGKAAVPSLHPGRVDVIGGGALIWSRVIDRLVETSGVTEVITSEHDILDGIALSVVAPHA